MKETREEKTAEKNTAKGLTPMMKQFRDFKAEYPDALLLFRCGDFYETYCEDASIAARVLGITLTRRNNGGENADTLMAGFPYHALDVYLPRLIRAGHRVAICDQLEDPRLAKKLVKRGVTELVTPGVVMSDNMLSARENNFLAAVYCGLSNLGLSLLDISTGQWLAAEGSEREIGKLLGTFGAKEILVERGAKGTVAALMRSKPSFYEMDDWAFAPQTAAEKLSRHFGTHSLKGFGVERMKEGLAAAAAILAYLELTRHNDLRHLTRLRRIEESDYVRIDSFTMRNLELFDPIAPEGATLFGVMDKTATPMGARMLRRWLAFPLLDIKKITRRQDGIDRFFRAPDFRDACTDFLGRIGDLERIVSRIATRRVTPREMQTLRQTLESTGHLKKACLDGDTPEIVQAIGNALDDLPDLAGKIARTLSAELPAAVGKGNVIATGVSDELDRLRHMAHEGKSYLDDMRRRESENTGIPSLKIAYNNIFGYYIEVRNTYKDRVPPSWIRKQTLVNAERYITPELKAYEEKILGAEEKILALEAQLFGGLIDETALYVASLQHTAEALARLDCLRALALTAMQQRYVRPVVDNSLDIDIRQGRHPVIETLMPAGEEYVPNDIALSSDGTQIAIVTGPNMAGKSALLRQTALIVLMAQIGSFVPATSARIGIVDKIFTRVGANDNLAAGESTFMVEMAEAASIMNNLSPRSLVLFDELGRGTSTYDGISIAWAIVERLHENPTAHARTLFATHYHELGEMESRFARIKNFNVSVTEENGQILFLRKLAPGAAAHSFGIHVARMAGMPREIVDRAEEVLKDLEAQHAGKDKATPAPEAGKGGTQLSFFKLEDPVLEQVRDKILNLRLDRLTPLEALTKLYDIQRIVRGK